MTSTGQIDALYKIRMELVVARAQFDVVNSWAKVYKPFSPWMLEKMDEAIKLADELMIDLEERQRASRERLGRVAVTVYESEANKHVEPTVARAINGLVMVGKRGPAFGGAR